MDYSDRGGEPISAELLARYLYDQTTAAEAEQIRRWFADEPERKREIEALDRIFDLGSRDDAGPNVDRFWDKLTERIGDDVATPHPAVSVRVPATLRLHVGAAAPTRRGWGWRIAGAVAASALVMAGAGIWHASQADHGARTARATTYVTRDGQRAEVMLSDGSAAVLSVGSRLEVPADFGGRNRTVRLWGQALFTVTHHDERPFVVQTTTSATRVLGTTFSVREYSTDSTSVIAVRSGKVAVGASVLMANQQVTVSRNGRVFVQPATAASFAFATGVLVLNSMPLGDALQELNRWYDADIRLADSSLATHMVHGPFTAGTPADLATILEFMFHARVERNGRVLTIHAQ